MKRRMTKEDCEAKGMEWVNEYHRSGHGFSLIRGYCRKRQNKDWNSSKEREYLMDIKLVNLEKERLVRLKTKMEAMPFPASKKLEKDIKDSNERIQYYQHKISQEKREKYKGVR